MCEKPFFCLYLCCTVSVSFSLLLDPGLCCMRARLGFHGYLFYIKTRFLRVRPPPPPAVHLGLCSRKNTLISN